MRRVQEEDKAERGLKYQTTSRISFRSSPRTPLSKDNHSPQQLDCTIELTAPLLARSTSRQDTMAEFVKKAAGSNQQQGASQTGQSQTQDSSTQRGSSKHVRQGIDLIEGKVGLDQKRESQAEKNADEKITSAISGQIDKQFGGHKT